MKKPTYRWKREGWGIDATEAGDALEQLRIKNNGLLTPKAIVHAARSPKSVLHPAFEWDDSTAAEAYREVQAGDLMRSITVVIERQEPHHEDKQTRAFVSVQQEEQVGYTSIRHAMSDADLRKQVLERAWKELSEWRQRYADLVELAAIFQAMDENPPDKKVG